MQDRRLSVASGLLLPRQPVIDLSPFILRILVEYAKSEGESRCYPGDCVSVSCIVKRHHDLISYQESH